jgi:hypothetical protein
VGSVSLGLREFVVVTADLAVQQGLRQQHFAADRQQQLKR